MLERGREVSKWVEVFHIVWTGKLCVQDTLCGFSERQRYWAGAGVIESIKLQSNE